MRQLLFFIVISLALGCFSNVYAQYRFWYVTDTNHMGSDTLTACAEGYHFASITELSDPSGLVYDVKANLGGMNRFDIGHGVAIRAEAWVRSGYDDGSEWSCSLWTSSDSGQTGTTAWLDFDTANLNPWVLKWVGQKLTCDTEYRVHCVSDIIQPPPPEIMYCSGFETCPNN